MPKKTTQNTAAKETIKKKTAAKNTETKKSVTEEAPAKKARSTVKKSSVARSNGIGDKKATPIVFSLDDVEALVASRSRPEDKTEEKAPAAGSTPVARKKTVEVEDAPTEKRVLGAASLADILGFNPAAKKEETKLDEEDIPKKWKKFYNLLIELRQHVSDELDLHTADTLKHSSRDDSGDLSGYSNHQADAGTDTFDRDFALSLVSSEQDALNEIEEAILRIKNGSYGICEVTGEPIGKERLAAVPFARFSVEGQAEYEKNKRRKTERSSAGLFGDGTDSPKIASDDDDE
ncbi:TraR/DksA C4-type zinc finger protein [Coraliomargarita parva]|uniref:TraR/DksA C4-type zinc finger protein n=1 Tax=Coraliomargarita parva TaxID=3014050 RepID=UPI0022B3D42E|nr:TraR/DksA C4-type zinc finger protein [Coraliomargarita parva]